MGNRIALFFLFVCFTSFGTDPYPRNAGVDILHYTFRLELNDTTNIIVGHSDVTVLFTQQVDRFTLNLKDREQDGTGMRVFGITQSGKPVWFTHQGDNLDVHLTELIKPGDTATYLVSYSGIPSDGLTIGTNKFGDRTFFGDNWPDRGRHWLPAVDHPHDKAKVDFIITAPSHYKVIATGELVGERERPRNRTETHWREHTDVPIKVITIGVARFSVQQSGTVGSIPVTTWVFPQNEKEGFIDFAIGPDVLTFLQNYIGPYPYEKLAHVQSKTRWGGLENVSNIFYFENSVTGKKERDGLIAHETAHQWFGNSVTEDDWHHVWLSEGFATYFSALFLGSAYGDERLRKEMAVSRAEVIEHAKKNKSLIIDTTILDIGKVLSVSTYQKASWVLHMLRAKIGDENFQRGIRQYYGSFRDRNAMTSDFVRIMEEVSGQELDPFFDSWLFQAGLPKLSGSWWFDSKQKAIKIQLRTKGFKCAPGTSVDVRLTTSGGASTTVKCPLDGTGDSPMSVPLREKPAQVVLDPGVLLLFEGEITEKR